MRERERYNSVRPHTLAQRVVMDAIIAGARVIAWLAVRPRSPASWRKKIPREQLRRR